MALQESTKKLIEERNKIVDPTTPGDIPQISTTDLFRGMGFTYDPAVSQAEPSILTVPMAEPHRSAQRRLGVGYDPYFGDLNERLAQDQSVAERLAYLIPRVGTKVLSEVAQIPGYLGGLGLWAGTGFDTSEIGKMIDNGWINAVQSAEESVKEAMPVFTPKAVQEGGLAANIFSSSFWANEGADGIGFLLAMLVPGQALKAMKAGKGIVSLPKLVKPGFQPTQAAISKADQLSAAVVNTLYEAGAEAGETWRDMMGKTDDEGNPLYGPNEAGQAAAQTMKSNFAILLGPNILQQRWLFGGFNRAAAASTNVSRQVQKATLSRLINKQTGELLSDVAARPKWYKANKIVVNALKGIGAEGFFEEGMQYASAELAKEKAAEGEQNGIFENVIGTIETYLDNISETEMQKNIFLGAVLGGGMTTISSIRDLQQEEQLLKGTTAKTRKGIAKFIGLQDRRETPGLHSLLQNNYLTRYRTFMDLVERDSNGEPVVEDGQYKLDPVKVKEAGSSAVRDVQRKQTMALFAQMGMREGYEYLKQQSDFDYMLPYLQQPGGFELLKQHINHMAERDAASFEEETGIAPGDMNDIKADLLQKAETYNKIVNRVEQRHAPNFNIRHDPADTELFQQYSQGVKYSKFSEAALQDHYVRRINLIKKELADYAKGDQKVPIVPEGDETYKEALDRQKADLSQGDIDVINNAIDDMNAHEQGLKESKTREKDLYNKTTLQKGYNEFVENKRKADQDVEDSVDNAKKTQTISGLNPKLHGLYDSNVKHETVRVGQDEFDATHSAEIEVTYTDNEGNEQKATVSIVPGRADTRQGNLIVEDADGRRAFINADDTFAYSKEETYKINDITTKKPVDEVINERQLEARLGSLKAQIDDYNSRIVEAQNRISKGVDYLADLMDRQQKLQQKESESLDKYGTKLTRKGATRVESIKILRGRGKRITQMYLNGEQIQQEINNVINELQKTERAVDNWIKELEALQEQKAQVLASTTDKSASEVLDFQMELLQDQINQTDTVAQEASDAARTADNYLKKLHTLMRGYNTTAARLLGISDRIAFIRSSDMSDEAKAEAEFTAIASALHATDGLTDEFNEIDGVLDNIINVRNKIRETEDAFSAAMGDLVTFDQQRERLKAAIAKRTNIRDKFQRYYRDYLDSLGLLSINVDEEASKNESKEDTFKGLNNNQKNLTDQWEDDAKHPFVDATSWFITQGNQEALVNPEKFGDLYTDSDLADMARWQMFVGDYASWTFKDKKSKFKGKGKFLVKTFSYDIISEFKEDHAFRDKLKFWAGEKYGLNSYNELQELPEEARETARDDLKVVAYERKEVKGEMKVSPLVADVEGNIDTKNPTEIFFTSLPTSSTKTARDFERFSLKNMIKAKTIELLKEENLQVKWEDAPANIAQKAKKYAQGVLEKSSEDYAEIREGLKKTSMYFNIQSITPGKKLYENAAPQEVLEAIGKEAKDIKFISFKIYDEQDAQEKPEGTRFPTQAGYGYVRYRGRLEAVTPKTLAETNSVDDVVNLFRYLAQNPENRTIIETYIKQIVNMNNSVPEFRLAFIRPTGFKGLRSGTFSKVIFGERGEVTQEQLANNEGLEEFRKFLESKYWNFDRKALRQETFTEFKVDNNLKLTEKTWEKKQGGYKAFLFSPDVSKGTIYIAPRTKSENLATRQPQYINQALRLKQAGTQQEIAGQVIPKKTGVVHINKFTKDTTPQTSTPKKAGGRFAAAKAEAEGKTVKEESPQKEGFFARTRAQNEKTEETPATEEKWAPTNPQDVVHGASEANSTTSESTLQQEPPAPQETGFTDASAYFAWLESADVRKHAHYITRYGDKAAEKAFAAYQNQQRGGNVYRLATDVVRYRQMDTAAARQYLEQKFPDFPIEVVAGLIDGRAWGQFYKGSKVLLSSLGAVGTEYHEAFHVVSQIFLSPEERNSLYSETKKVLDKPNATDEQIEEILAEEFREYMMADGNYKFGKTVEVKKTTFQKILDYLLQLVNGLFGTSINKPSQALDLFEEINQREFTLADRKSWSEATLNRIGDLSEAETTAYVKDINYHFFQKLFGPTEIIDEEGVFRLQDDVNFRTQLYAELKQDYEDILYEELSREYQEPDINNVPEDFYSNAHGILQNWDKFVNRHKEYLQQYGLDIRELIDEEDRVIDSVNYFESNTVSMSAVAPQAIRLTIAGLPSVVRNSEGTIDKAWSSFDTNSTAAYDRIMNILKNSLSNVDTFWGMIDRVQGLRVQYPEMDVLLTRLGLPLDSNDIADLSDAQLRLVTQFYRTFSNNKNSPKIFIFESNGRRSTINAVDNQESRIIKNGWLNRGKAIAANKNSLVSRTKDGKYIVDKAAYINGVAAIATMPSDQDKVDQAYAIVNATGLDLDKYLDHFTNSEVLLTYVSQTAKQLKTIKDDVTIQDLFNPNIVKSQAETNRLVEYAASLVPNDSDLMFINQDNKSEYSVTLNSHISNVVTRLNEVADTGDITVASQYLFDNLFSTNSRWLGYIKDGRRLSLSLIRGAKSFGTGQDTSRLAHIDYKSILFNSILDNSIPMLRAADRKLEYAFKMEETNFAITDARFLSTSMDYLKDELLTGFALIANDIGNDLFNYKNNGRELRSFDYLFDKNFTKGFKGTLPSLESFVGDKVEIDEELSHDRMMELADTYISENKVLLEKIIKKYNSQSIDLNIEALLEDGVIEEGVDVYFPSGVDAGLMADAGIKVSNSGSISASDMRQLARVATYNYFVGAQEQLKLFFGDLAMFSNVDNFHKRTTGAASTRQKLLNDQWFLDQLDERYQRFDGQHHERSMKKIVYDDITKPSSRVDANLKKVSNKYSKANGVDAQVWATLDEYRSIMLRNGSWFTGNEKTYQYEMQQLALRILKDKDLQKIYKVTEDIFTDESGMFYYHTDGKVPTAPMYEGKKLSQKELTPLPPLKPQSFGHIENVDRLNATQFYKLSMAPVFPSLLEGDMLKHHLSMIAAGAGSFGFVSADKVTHILNKGQTNQFLGKDGTPQLVTPDSAVIQTMSYDEFGIQLNIAEDPKGAVSRSTQRERLEYLDMFDKGKQIIENDLYDEYYDIIDKIANEDFRNLVTELGLTKGKDDLYELTPENAEKFGKVLERVFFQRAMPYNAIDGIKAVIKSDMKVFDALVNKNKIEEVLMSLIGNRIIRRKTNGELLVQESSYLYFGDNLEFYKKDPNETVPMQVAVPLPKEWLDVVEMHGGLDMLNGLITDRNWAKLRSLFGDIDRVLDISGVRIPAQGLNSMEAMRIIRFLPPHVGGKILMPHEVTVKAGSDFDIDKLTTYMKNATVKDDKIVYHDPEKEDTSKSRENRLNDISFTTLLDPARYDELLTPNEDTTVKALADTIKAKQTPTAIDNAYDSQNWSKATQLWYNFRRAAEFWGGKKVIGLAAVHNKSHATHQQYPVRIANENVKLFFQGQEAGNYTSGHLYDADGRKISKNMSEFMTSFLDVAKDPRVFYLNTNVDAFNTWAFLNKYGTEAGVGLETLAHFMTQPIVLRYLKAVRKSRSLTHKTDTRTENLFRGGIIDRLFGQLDAESIKGVPSTYDQTLAASYDKYFNAAPDSIERQDALEELRVKLAKYDYKPLTKAQLKGKLSNKDMIQVLDNYMSYEFFGQQLTNLNTVTNDDAGMEQNMNSMESKRAMVDKLTTNGFFNADDVRDIIESGLVGTFNNIKNETKKAFSWGFITKKYPEVNAYFYERFVVPFSDKIWNRAKRNNALKAVESDFITFLIEVTGRSYAEVRADYEDLLFSDNSAAKQLIAAKKALNNELVQELEPVINEHDNVTRLNSPMDYITTYDKRADLYQQNSYTSAWYDLLEHPDKGVQSFGRRLMRTALYESGTNNSPISFLKYAPNEAYIDMAEKALKQFAQLPAHVQKELMKSFEEQFYRNNWDNSDIVPRRPSVKKKPQLTWAPFGPREWSESNPYFTRGYMSARGQYYTILYKKIVNAHTGRVTFVAVPKMGNGYKFKEYYPIMSDDVSRTEFKSLLPTNHRNLGYPVLDQPDAPQFEASPIPEAPGYDEHNAVESARASFESGEMLALDDEVGRIKDILSELNREDIPDSVKEGLRMELEGLYYKGPGDAILRTDKLAIRETQALKTKVEDFLQAIGFSLEMVDKIYDRFGKEVPNAVAMASISQKTVQAVQGKLVVHHLPEEAAHVYVAMLPDTHNLKKSMLRNIVNYRIYDRVKEKYAEVYENDEALIREEAVGQLIAEHMVQLNREDMVHTPDLTERQHTQLNNWWKALWANIRRMFGLDTAFKRSAYNIMNLELEGIVRQAEELGRDASLYALDSMSWNNLFSDKQIGNVKYRYFRTTAQAEEYLKQAKEAFGHQNVSMIPKQGKELAKVILKNPDYKQTPREETTAVTAENNFKEFAKEGDTITSKEEVLTNFDKYYPAMSHLNSIERTAFVDALSIGELEQICGL